MSGLPTSGCPWSQSMSSACLIYSKPDAATKPAVWCCYLDYTVQTLRLQNKLSVPSTDHYNCHLSPLPKTIINVTASNKRYRLSYFGRSIVNVIPELVRNIRRSSYRFSSPCCIRSPSSRGWWAGMSSAWTRGNYRSWCIHGSDSRLPAGKRNPTGNAWNKTKNKWRPVTTDVR
jgi:hypothetical protein